MDKNNYRKTCMACSCPCEKHKEHAHDENKGVGIPEPKQGGVCKTCGIQKEGSKCGCN